MKPKSLLIAAVTAAAGTGLAVAAWWSFFQAPADVPLAGNAPKQPISGKALPAAPLATQTSPTGPTAAGQSLPNVEVAGVTKPNGIGSAQKPSRPTAALPWGSATDAKGPDARAAASASVALPASSTSVADAATTLKFSPAVIAWLGTWEKNMRAGIPTAARDVTEFERLLTGETAAIDALLSLMRAAQTLEDRPKNPHFERYPPVTGAIACRAVTSGAERADGDAKQRYLLMHRIAPLIERLRYGAASHARAVQRFYESLARHEVKGAPDWIRGHLGSAEALGMQKLYSTALETLDRLEAGCPNPDAALAIKFQFTRGCLLYDAQREKDAIPHLQPAADSPEFTERRYAREILMRCHAITGNVEQTAAVFREYLRDYDVPAWQSQQMLNGFRTELARHRQLVAKD
jgi:hypothetical protein